MAFGIGSGSTRLSWTYGDTPLYRFVFDIPSDAQLPQGTMLDFSIRTPNGVRVCSFTRPLEMPLGNLPYFELFISPTLSFNTPPGNYVFTLGLKRPYDGVGNYRYTALPSGSVSVGGVQSLLPENLIELEGNTDPPPPIEIHIDAKPFIARAASSTYVPPVPDTPPKVTLEAITVPENPTTANPVTKTTLTATIVKGTQNLTGEIEFSRDGVFLGSIPASPYVSGGIATYVSEQPYSADAVFSVKVTDGTLTTQANVTVTVPAPPAVAEFTVAPTGTPSTTALTIAFIAHADAITSDLIADEITLSDGITKGALTKVDSTTYTLAITAVTGGEKTVTITKAGASDQPVAVNVITTAEYAVTASGTPITDALTITFTAYPELITPDLVESEITLSDSLTKGTLTKVDNTTYTLAVTPVNLGTTEQTVTIIKANVYDQPTAVNVAKVQASFTVTPTGTPITDAVTIVFTAYPELVIPDLIADEIALSSGVNKGTLTKVDDTTYTLAVTPTADGTTEQTVTITKANVDPQPVPFTTTKVYATFSVAASGTPHTDTLTIQFTNYPELVTPDLTDTEITLSVGLTKGALTKVDDTTYTLGVTTTVGGTKNVTLTKANVSASPVSVVVVRGVASYTVTPSGSPKTDMLTIKFTVNPELVTPDLTADEITLSAGLTKGVLTKADAETYTLAVIATESETTTQTLWITKADVKSAPVTFSVDGPAEGWYGVAYNHYTEPPAFSDPTTPPTADEITALTSKTVITGAKRNLTMGYELNEADWRAATNDPGAFAEYACGRAFIITRSWGIPLDVVTSGFPVMSAFSQFTVDIDGMTYTGMIANGSPVVYDGTEYNWKFV